MATYHLYTCIFIPYGRSNTELAEHLYRRTYKRLPHSKQSQNEEVANIMAAKHTIVMYVGPVLVIRGEPAYT